ncbi:hypothetical protein [Spirosoma endophyticum]|uniref:Uncharacterized protein n=1 Tax=Spirosoma endophyticum TaxID=662367 RepID=A0A1I2HW10_9BACT|nr:hypothetical protein [Spirosoma endophyticum]SFF32927.1 hypothetical protein SAMN05216167_14819 [Spirosoma endophyticum]
MIFFFTTADALGEIREAFVGEVDLEVGLGLLDNIAAEGHRLLQVSILEAGRLNDVPVEALTGIAHLPALRKLQRAWQQILSDPVEIKALYTQHLLVLRIRRIRRHETCIACLEQLVDQSRLRFQHVSKAILREPHRSRMLHQLEATLKRHQQTLVTEQASLQRLLA